MIPACLALAANFWGAAPVAVSPFHPSVRILGRFDSTAKGAELSWSGTGFQVAFEGASCKARITSSGAILGVTVDNIRRPDLDLVVPAKDTLVDLASGLGKGRHVVEVAKKTEAMVGSIVLHGILVDGNASTPPPAKNRRIEFVGNSITCGYGVLDSAKEHGFSPKTQDFSATFAALAAENLRADAQTVCYSGRGLARNYDGSSSEPLPTLFRRAVLSADARPWNHSRWKPDVVVVDLGTNDFAKAPPPDSAKWESSWMDYLSQIREAYGDLPIVLANGPMLSDFWPLDASGKPVPSLTKVRTHLRNVAKAAKQKGFASVSVLDLSPNSADRGYGADWHPNRAQAALNARELTEHLRKTMSW